MSFLANLGYRFALPGDATSAGSIVLASALTSHQLLRRRFNQYPHMEQRLFDPQLYLATLDAGAARKHCAKLASYPWFGVDGVDAYLSGEQRLGGWQAATELRIAE